MGLLKITPNGGLNRRFPEHKLVGKEVQKVQCLENLLNLDGRTTIFQGASRIIDSSVPGDIKWSKKIYYSIGGDYKKDQFFISAGKFYKYNEANRTVSQVPISGDYDLTIETTFYPIDATIKVAEQVTTFLVDGEFFYKFNGNDTGNWDRLPIKQDIDGNDMEPIFICEYLDRLAVLVKSKNIVILSSNLNPEEYNNATDSVIIEVPPGYGGFPTGLVVNRGFLYVVHEDYIAPITGSSPSTFGVRPGDVIYGYGTRAPRSIFNLGEEFGFLNSKNNEIHTTNDLKTPLSYDIKLKELINPVKADQTVVHIDTKLNALRVGYVLTGESTLNAEEIYSLDEKKWCGQTRNRYISTYSQWNGRGDDGRLLTGRSDQGLMMWEDDSINFDSTAIHYKWVSASYVVDDGVNEAQFTNFYLDAKPQGNYAIPLYYYLDARITTNGNESVNMQGEIIGLGLIVIADQNVFLNRAKPFIDKSKGRMIRFQIEETTSNRLLEFYGIYVDFNVQNKKQSKYLVGR